MLKLEINPYNLNFKFQAKTSRGSMSKRLVWFIQVFDEAGGSGIGEVAPIANLSFENIEEIPAVLVQIGEKLLATEIPKNESEIFDLVDTLVPEEHSSIKMGLQCALLDLINGGEKNIFSEELSSISIPANGLVWMGDPDFMKEQIRQKLEEGCDCIKLKVGSLDFETEVEIIKKLRAISADLIIRIDANGAFSPNEALGKLKTLAKYSIHSIEQPILPSQREAMEMICRKSEIPIALDEELVGVFEENEKIKLLEEIKPQYIVLKPSLHGGFKSTQSWIELANKLEIGWWITSYLESNIGLNAIAQFTSRYPLHLHQGLGTGGLYDNNIKSPLQVSRGVLSYNTTKWGVIGE